MNGASMTKSATIGVPHCFPDTLAMRETQVAREMVRQDAALQRMWTILTDVEARLVTVMRPVPNVLAEAQPRDVKVPLAEQLEKHTDSIDEAAERLICIMNRLEL